MWEQVGLIGRDAVLSKHVYPRIKRKTGFVLTGQHGIGKTAILQWAFEKAEGRKTMVSAAWPQGQTLRTICSDWGLEIMGDNEKPKRKQSWKAPEMEMAINREQGLWLFIDDIHRATPSLLLRLKSFRDKHIIVATGVPPFNKEELKRLLWGLTYVEVKHLKKKDLRRIAEKAGPIIGSSTPVNEAVHACGGIPAHLLHSMRGEITPETAKGKDEEIDISPVILIAFGGVIVYRMLARDGGSASMTMFSGIMMAGVLVGRFFLFKGMSK